MDSIEISAKTVNEAIALALAKLGAQRDDVEITVLSEGRPGILGFGAEDARVRVRRRATAKEAAPHKVTPPIEEAIPASTSEVEIGKEVLERLLKLMKIEAKVKVRQPSGLQSVGSPEAPALDIVDRDLGILIGRRGQTLSSLQFMVNLIASKRLGRRTNLIVDVEGYRLRREESLRSLAQRMAERVVQTGQPIALEAMPASERRIVHLALANHPGVVTGSVGEGEQRKVVISPRK